MTLANTTIDALRGLERVSACCPYCGKPLPRTSVNIMGSTFSVPCTSGCDCEEAKAENARLNRADEETKRRDFGEKLYRAGIGLDRYKEARERVDRPLFARANKSLAEGRNVIVCGDNGQGKTLLAIALCSAALKRGKSALLVTSADLIHDDLERMDGGGRKLFDRAGSVDVLALDDLGKESASQYATAIIYEVVNGRSESRRPTVVTTNLGGCELVAHFADTSSGKAIVSRIMENAETIRMEGRDMRVSKNTNR